MSGGGLLASHSFINARSVLHHLLTFLGLTLLAASNGISTAMKGGGPGSESPWSLCFQLTFQSLEGYANLLSRKTEKHTANSEYVLHSCLYNTASRQFIGRFHDTLPCSLVESLQSGAVICPIEQVAFFYSPHSEPTLIVVTELIASYSSGGVELCVGLGWSMLPVFDHHGNQSRPAMGGSSSGVRLALYEGSPRALFSLTHPTAADSKELVPVPGCILTCALCPHSILAKATHLIPGNVLVSYDDIIPGLVHTTVHEAFPKLLKTVASGSLEKVSLLLLPSVDDFEEQLLAALAEDLGSQDTGYLFVGGGTTSKEALAGVLCREVVGGSECGPVAIEERRLKVLQYNGWRFTGSPVIGYLERVSPSVKPSGSFRGSMHSLRSNLVLKGSLELAGLLAHPLLEVLLQLEYLISWSQPATAAGTAPTGSSRRSLQSTTSQASACHTTAITLGWAVWQPFDSEGAPLEQESQTSLDLKQGPGFLPTVIPNSAHKTCYEGALNDAGKINFRFVPSRVSSRAESSQYFNASASSAQYEDAMQRPSGKDMPDSGAQPQQHSPTLSNKLAVKETSNEAVTKELTLAELTQPAAAIDVKHRGVTARRDHSTADAKYGVSRSLLAYFHTAGFEEFTDLKGNPLPMVTMPMPTPPPSLDALSEGPFQIAVHFLAFKPSEGVGGAPPPSSLLLSSHFHHFPSSTVSCGLAPSTREPTGGVAGGGVKTGLPLLIQPAEGGGKNGVVWCYHVHHGTLPSMEDRHGFTSFLSHGRLITDLYDRGSLLLLGTAHVPLQSLLCCEAEEFHQCTLSVPVVLSPATTDCTLPTASMQLGEPGSSEAGQLYVRLARLPADNRDNSAAHTHAAKPLPHRTRLARRLYGSHTPWGVGPEGGGEERARRRKHARMQSVRELKANLPSQLSQTQPSFSQTVIELQREELKRGCITSVLRDAITTSYVLRPRMGRVVYFEHEFGNVHKHAVTVNATWKDAKLRMVTDRTECSYLRQKHSIHTVMDDNLITENYQEAGSKQQYGFFVHPGETVRLPFKYQSFQLARHHPSPSCDPPSQKTSIAVFLQTAHNELLAVLNVEIDLLDQRTDRVFHFYHPEQSFLKRSFPLQEGLLEAHSEGSLQCGPEAGFSSLPCTSKELFACASDPDIMCEIRKAANGAETVFVKAPVKQAPLVNSFHIMLYNNKYLFSPLEVWRIIVHSARRVDHSLVLGQSSPLRLALHGNHADRRVSCHSFSPPFVKVVSPSPFLLTAHSLTELQFSLKTLHSSSPTSTVIVSAVNVECSRLLDVWLVGVTAVQPAVSRAFKITLPQGGENRIEKSITFTNPYPRRRQFHVSTSRPSILSFTSPTLQLRGHEASSLELLFAPSGHTMSCELLVFINDDHDQTEECFLVRILYD